MVTRSKLRTCLSSHHLTALVILQWGRLFGRKPVLLFGVFGLALSMMCFGLSKSFCALVISSGLAGKQNLRHIGVLRYLSQADT